MRWYKIVRVGTSAGFWVSIFGRSSFHTQSIAMQWSNDHERPINNDEISTKHHSYQCLQHKCSSCIELKCCSGHVRFCPPCILACACILYIRISIMQSALANSTCRNEFAMQFYLRQSLTFIILDNFVSHHFSLTSIFRRYWLSLFVAEHAIFSAVDPTKSGETQNPARGGNAFRLFT